MENKGGLRIVSKNGPGTESSSLPETPQELGATGFYYITPADAWDETSLLGSRVYFKLVTLPIYILRELLKGVLLATAVFSLVLMAVFAGQVMRDGIGPYTLIRVLPNFLPLICPFVLPLAIITGILICYSRLAKDNEILAAYAGGVNPFWLMLPALLTSVIAIFIALAMNEVALQPATLNIERLVIDDQANIFRRMIARPGNITVPTGDEYMTMTKLDPSRDPGRRTALDITRFVTVPEAERNAEQSTAEPGREAKQFPWDTRYYFPTKRVTARDHHVQDFSESGGQEMLLKMQVSKPVVQDLHATDIDKSFIAGSESGEERILFGGRPSVTIHSNRSSFWPILKLADSRRETEKDLEKLIANEGQLDQMPPEQRALAENMRKSYENRILDRTSEIHMRLSLCFSCIAFALLGIPLGMRTRGTLVSSFAVGIVMAGIYFLALKSAEGQVAKGLMPFWVIWIPNVFVALLGVVMWLFSSRRV